MTIKLASDFGNFVNQIQGKAQQPGIATSAEGEGIVSGSVTSPQQFYYTLIYAGIWILAVIAVLVLIYAGVKYITAGADEEKVSSAKRTIIGAIIGLIIIASALVVYNFVIGMFS
jgi:hypothetical protein